MDNSKMTFRFMRKPPGRQPSSDDQPICPSSQGYTQRANTDDDFWAQPEENKTYQPAQGSPTRLTGVTAAPEASLGCTAASKQGRSQSGPMGQEGVKGRQAKAQPYKGAELLTEPNRRIEVSKRKRAGSTSDVQDESAAKQQKLTKAGTDARGQDHAIFEEERKRPVEGRLKTTIAGEEEENPFPVKRPKLTAYQHIGFGPLTMNPRVPKKRPQIPRLRISMQGGTSKRHQHNHVLSRSMKW